MKVKIKNQIYNSKETPICIELEDEEKKLISNMGTQNKYCGYPESLNPQDIKTFMKMKKDYRVLETIEKLKILGYPVEEGVNSNLKVFDVEFWCSTQKWHDAETGKKGLTLKEYLEYLNVKKIEKSIAFLEDIGYKVKSKIL